MKKGKTENLKPFPPGTTGNPNGRPKKLPGLDELLSECLGENGGEAKAIINALIAKAKKGDVRAAEIILDRMYGKAKQGLDLSGTLTMQGSGFDYTQLNDQDLTMITKIINKYEQRPD